MPKAIIIGGGIGGLATANLLAKQGWRVDVYEQRSQLGGRAGLIEIGGFQFDSGPSWYLMPDAFEHYYELLDESVESQYNLSKLDPAYKVFYDYRAPLTIHADRRDNATFEAVEPGAANALADYLKLSKSTYDTAIARFLYNPFTHKRTLLRNQSMRELPFLARQLRTSLHSHVKTHFKNLALQQIMEYPSVFLGTSPFKAPALYHLMSHMDFTQGVFYPEGGIYAIIRSLVRLGRKYGVNYHPKTAVSRIETERNHARGIVLMDGTFKGADIIISNADRHFTETELLSAGARDHSERYWQKASAGPSALLLYLGVKGKLPQLLHHNLLFTKAWQTNFSDITDRKIWPHLPSMYICKPSATDPTTAPQGYENMFVLVPLPATTGQSKQFVKDQIRRYLKLIAAYCDIPDLEERIVLQRAMTPDDFAQQFNAWQGTALGLSHTLRQSALFRPANKSRKIKNLYYVGADNRPGIGIPMCLISAEIVYKHITGDDSAGPLQSLGNSRGWHV